MKTYKHYFFDLDGTLLNTVELIYQNFCQTCARYTGKEIARDEVLKYIGIPLLQQMKIYCGDRSDDEMEEILSFHRSYQRQIFREYLEIYPGVGETLELLSSRAETMAVVTSRNRESLIEYLEYFHLDTFFDLIVSPENTVRHKPAPDPLLYAIDQLAAEPRESLFVGDADFDILCGNRAGVDTAFALWGPNDPAMLEGQPSWQLEKIGDLLI